jgi:formate-dependent nitrite reductase cytochrome c552 subunit
MVSDSTGNCTLCHSDSDPGTGSHNAHLDASVAGTFGRDDIGCTSCHVDNSGDTAHLNQAVNFSGVTYSLSSCGTNTCHNDGTGNTPATAYTWGNSYANCTICHPATPTQAHGAHLAHPTVDCTDCHAATSSTDMGGQTTHIDQSVTMAAKASAYNGTVTVGDGGAFGSCDTGACHDASSDPAWNATPALLDCDDCHYNTLDVNSFNGRDETASVVASSEWASFGHSAQGVGCSDCHDLPGTSHDFSAALDSLSNPFRLGTAFTIGSGCNTQGACHTISVVNHSQAAISAAGGSPKYSWALNPECLNCHDPHGDGSNRFMISREIWDEETGTFNPTGAPPVMPTEQLSLAFTDTTTGISGAGDSYADSSSPFSSICQECHTQTGGGNGFIDDTSANYSGHAGFPGNPGDCDQCHKHDTGFTAGCAGCHAYPPTSGAHQAHGGTAGGKPEFNCETCHGPNPGSATWHNESSASTYDSNNATHYNNVTFNHNLTALQRDTEDAYYNTTWTRSGASVAPTVTRAGGYAFECANVYCHGLESVTWTWDADGGGSPSNPAVEAEYRTCGGCHGLGGDVDSDGAIDTSSFRSRSGTLYDATNTAVNYMGPLSLFSRGGHGDTLINHAQWAENTADNGTTDWQIPVGCADCHDSTADHFPTATNDRYRVGSIIAAGGQTKVTTLCVRCHAEQTGDYHFLEVPKHPSDYFDFDWTGTVQSNVLVTDGTMSVFSTHDPANVSGVGTHIDQYVDHWAYWGTEATTTTDDDYTPFLPMGDSLDSAWNANNDGADRVTCITCHNPHGTDLYVNGQTPGVATSSVQIPANKMLRLRDTDHELCGACHR